MSKLNDGGPAFPPHASSTADEYMGMSLRDYFAAKAMQGMLACPIQMQSGSDMFARDAYVVADAMLRAREAK